MFSEFFTGIRMLLRGFGLWRRNPALMLLGLLPALIALALIAAVLVPYGFALGPITSWLTPFAENWDGLWQMLLRGAISVVLFVAGLVLAGLTFTAISLAIGDPFYQRIWAAIEAELGEAPAGRGSSFANALRESLRLLVFGILSALIVLLIGFVPLVGGALGAIVGLVLSGRLLARAMLGRSFDARAIDRTERSRTIARSRARVLGFGMATQLCFMIPFGALFAMPAAVAGATYLARSVIERADAARAPAAEPPPGVPDA